MSSPSPAGFERRPALPLILLLAAGYFLLGRVSLLLSVPPGFASSVWPAAGVSLMALLFGGRRLWPGVLLGSFLVNFQTTFQGLEGVEMLRSARLPAAIGVGAALQAVLGAWAVKRWVGFPRDLTRSRDIFRLLALGGPVSCLVSATIGVTALVATASVLPADAAFHWWTWWVGDSIGVLVVVPTALGFLARRDREGADLRLRVGLPLAVATAAVIIVFFYARDQEWRRLDLEWSRSALSIAKAFEKDTGRSLEDLASIEALFASSERVSREEFGRFTERILERNPTFQALSWNPKVSNAERPAYEAAGRADCFAGYRFTETGSEGELRTAGTRAEYVVVHYIEPYTGNDQALGFDIASDPSRRAALERARDTGSPAATPGIRLVQERGEQSSVLILMPVYEGGGRPDTVEERQRTLRGYATGVLRLGDALRSALADLPRDGLTISLVDRSDPSHNRLLARLGEGPGPSDSTPFAWTFDRDLGGRIWSLRIAATPDLVAGQQNWNAWMVLAGGLLLVSLLGVLLLEQNGRAIELAEFNARLEEGLERRRRLVAEREDLIGELEQRNAELERFSYTVSHDLKGPLITIKGFLGLLEKDLEAGRPAEVDAEIAQLHLAADRMLELVSDLLDLARTGRASGPAEIIALDELVAEVIAQVSAGHSANGVRIEKEPNLPQVRAHRSQLLEVLQNLLDNALKFIGSRDDPRIEVGASREEEQVVCYVRDNGVGIDPIHQERIFGLFDRLDRNTEGTGIGLAVVRRIVEMSGGSVWVESPGEGHGSTFYFTLPAP